MMSLSLNCHEDGNQAIVKEELIRWLKVAVTNALWCQWLGISGVSFTQALAIFTHTKCIQSDQCEYSKTNFQQLRLVEPIPSQWPVKNEHLDMKHHLQPSFVNKMLSTAQLENAWKTRDEVSKIFDSTEILDKGVDAVVKAFSNFISNL